MGNEPKEECGVVGIYYPERGDICSDVYLSLYALQHRGQESCGIAVADGGEIRFHKAMGLVPEVFNKDDLAELGQGKIAIGHVRYAGADMRDEINDLPLVMRYVKGSLGIVFNGSLTNVAELKAELEPRGAIFQTQSDAEIISYILARERVDAGSMEAAAVRAMKRIKGAYSIVLMTAGKLIAMRDPNGFRPLCMGEVNGGTIFASESCAVDSIGATFTRDVAPGEVIVADANGVRSITDNCSDKSSLCIFEHIYFARPDSIIDGVSVHEARRRAGRLLARQNRTDADLVVGIPDSGIDAALGFSEESGIPYGIGFVKNRYVGRTFIKSTDRQRESAVRIKLNPLPAAIEGKRVILVDDSIVRGTTCANIVGLLRRCGAKEVHMRIASPPFLHVCWFGTDIRDEESLMAHGKDIDGICRELGADSLEYLSLSDLGKTTEGSHCGFCDACFSGNYPIEPPSGPTVDKYSRKISVKTPRLSGADS